jgi:hypothetical protein
VEPVILLASMNIAQKWLSHLPPAEIEADLAELRRQREVLDGEIATGERLLEIAKSVHTAESLSGDAPATGPPFGPSSETIPGLRDGIRRLLMEDPHRPWKLAEVFREMVSRKWLSDDASGRNRLQLRMAAMVSQGELVKPEYGYYQLGPHLPPAETDASPPDPLGRPWGSVPTGFTRCDGKEEP